MGKTLIVVFDCNVFMDIAEVTPTPTIGSLFYSIVDWKKQTEEPSTQTGRLQHRKILYAAESFSFASEGKITEDFEIVGFTSQHILDTIKYTMEDPNRNVSYTAEQVSALLALVVDFVADTSGEIIDDDRYSAEEIDLFGYEDARIYGLCKYLSQNFSWPVALVTADGPFYKKAKSLPSETIQVLTTEQFRHKLMFEKNLPAITQLAQTMNKTPSLSDWL